jgi:protein phosphatase
VRKVNQDHFLICSLKKQVQVHLTSLPNPAALANDTSRLAFVAMVADGVGGGQKGEDASRIAVETITNYLTEAVRTYNTADTSDHGGFTTILEEGALRCHADIVRQAEADPDRTGMATTLTLWIGIWPYGYLLQVGDSRCYVLHAGELIQLSRDQTMAQELMDQGVLSRTEAGQSRFAHVLSSSIGGRQTAPLVTRMEQAWDQPGLLCSDGLTKHVSDERIREVLAGMTSSRQACEQLLQEALDGGGSDNITIVIGRATRKGDA